MPTHADRQRFRNEDLVLKVGQAVDRNVWDESRYEAYLDELCQDREYQKDAIRTALRFFLSGQYQDLRSLARRNYETNTTLESRYGSWANMEKSLQLPNKLAASLDLATGTGKSYVLYGVSAILLAEGVVDRVLVLCPSTTIETGLLEKFRLLSTNTDLRDLLPQNAKVSSPRIINASESIVDGSICVENYHAILEHVGSSIRDSLLGQGERVAVLNDEAHHIANETAAKTKKWKEFLLDDGYGFRYILGVSGTCYVKDDYFSDVIYRYSLRQAMDNRYVKKVDYVAEMPKTADPDDRWQLIHNRHTDIRGRMVRYHLLPLTIIVTPSIERCKDVADELKHFLIETEQIDPKTADEKVLVVYNGASDVFRLPYIDQPQNAVEWIVSVSMLNEGWDVKRVFLIVPHEERAFNSKLLIAQVLGRGLRIPLAWQGAQPEVLVFNHDAWANSIRHLVNEILEVEKRITVQVLENSQFHFDLHNIRYSLDTTSVKKPMEREYKLFAKGYVDIATDVANQDVSVEFERASTGERYYWRTQIQHKTYAAREVAVEMYRRLEEAQDPDDPEARTPYTDEYTVEKLEQIVKASLERLNVSAATESMKQKFLQSLGTLRRKASESVRYISRPDRFYSVSTLERHADTVSAAELRDGKTLFYTDLTRETLKGEQVEFFDEATEEGSGYKCRRIANPYDLKSPLSGVIADSEPERLFIRELLHTSNLPHYQKFIKSTASRFYEIDFSWKKGEHPKRGKFSPDFFIKTDNLIIVVEIKGNEEIDDPSEENRKKNEYAQAHFEQVNRHLMEEGSTLRYKFNFLSPRNYITFFQLLREGKSADYRSDLDVSLTEEA